ncbi:MAG: hypothetical protein GXY76_04980 [Chloroflexi bacterium]|nr:hypothetical protein [Chloroflexota bacterium]
MNRRERLMATLRGDPVDRPGVCFYEINGLDERPDWDDQFNVYSDPSWLPAIELARDRTDRIPMRPMAFKGAPPSTPHVFAKVESWMEGGSRFTRRTIQAGARELTSLERRDPGVNTTWTLEPLLKGPEDAEAYAALPIPQFEIEADPTRVLATEAQLGDTGIVMLNFADPICMVAPLFELGEYTVVARTEPALFHRMLERALEFLLPLVEATSAALPGRLWRVVGPEYATSPFLPPSLFREYVVRYDTPIVQAILRHGGYPRVHCHGRLKDVLDDIVGMGTMGLDPVEPPPQGDVELAYVRERYGKQMALFGNIEASDIENLPTPQFAKKVERALREGTQGEGRGFVLLPSACPYGRKLTDLALANYRTMVELTEKWA